MAKYKNLNLKFQDLREYIHSLYVVEICDRQEYVEFDSNILSIKLERAGTNSKDANSELLGIVGMQRVLHCYRTLHTNEIWIRSVNIRKKFNFLLVRQV